MKQLVVKVNTRLFFCSFCAAAYCYVDTAMFPELKYVGVKYVRHGDTMRLACVHRFGWVSDHYSVVRCNEKGGTLSECKYDFIIIMHDFRLCLITTCRDGVLPA